MYVSPTAERRKATVRMMAPLASQGALLDVRSAEASTLEAQTPLIEPLDVNAIQAQLAAAERSMQAARAVTDDDIARLARLTR